MTHHPFYGAAVTTTTAASYVAILNILLQQITRVSL
jgi:hypothetical protein